MANGACNIDILRPVYLSKIKDELLLKEKEYNIKQRQMDVSECINIGIQKYSKILFGNKSLNLNKINQYISEYKYISNINYDEILNYIKDWNGVKITKNICQREYKKKASNWLNGKRACVYGNTLFPTFIQQTKQVYTDIYICWYIYVRYNIYMS